MNLSEAAADDMTAVAGHILQCVGGVPQLCLPALLVLSMWSRVRVRLCVCGRAPVRVCVHFAEATEILIGLAIIVLC